MLATNREKRKRKLKLCENKQESKQTFSNVDF